MSSQASAAAGVRPATGALSFEKLALAASVVTLAGSLYLSIGMGLVACPLCFYQRTFIMAVFAVLAVGMLLRPAPPEGTLSLLALPLAVGGLGVALAHSALVWNDTLVCPAGVGGLGSAPEQSLAAFAVVTALLLPGALRRDPGVSGGPVVAAGLAALGGVLAYLCILSAPKLPGYNPKFDAAGARVVKGCERANPEPPAQP